MSPTVRKVALVAHVTASVGWLGTVMAFLALAIVGLTSHDGERVRAVYLAMDLITWTAIVPLSIASLVSGLVQSLGTPWGLFRHYWVLVKLGLTLVSTGILLLHTQVITRVADVALRTQLSSTDLRRLRIQLAADAAAAVVALLITTALSIFKPKGVTRYGQRRLQAERHAPS